MIIGLSGYARAGKDTVGQILVDHHGYERRAFADKLRAVALGADPYVNVYRPGESLAEQINRHGYERLSFVVDRLGWDEAKQIPDVRRLLQRLGTEGVRDNLGPHTWVDAAFTYLPERSVFTDVRFPNEAAAIQGLGGQVWRVIRPGIEAVNAHASEQVLTADLEIQNDCTIEALANAVSIALAMNGAK